MTSPLNSTMALLFDLRAALLADGLDPNLIVWGPWWQAEYYAV